MRQSWRNLRGWVHASMSLHNARLRRHGGDVVGSAIRVLYTDRMNAPIFEWPAPGQTQPLLLPGAAGNIETILSAPRGQARGCAVICHPHPLFGGAMTNKVTYTLASVATMAGFYALRFNFRGVGKSEGEHDQAVGETDDTVGLAELMLSRMPAGAPLLLAGFSFGGYVSVRAAERLRPALQISVAPPFGGRFAYSITPKRPDCPWLVIHSRDDDVVSYSETAAALSQYQPAPEIAMLDGAGHFFDGRLGDIRTIAGEFIERHLPYR